MQTALTVIETTCTVTSPDQLRLDSSLPVATDQRVRLESRVDEMNADDHSRLSWLYLRLNDDQRAADVAKRGLDMDPANIHCLKLAERWS